MISVRQLAGALYGVWLLYKFDARAWTYFEKTPSGFWASFIVAGILAPLHFTHKLLQYGTLESDLALVPYMVVQVLAYVVSWTLFPFAMLYIARLLDRSPRYLWHVVPYNWMQLPLALPLFTIQVLTDLQFLPPEVLGFLSPIILVAYLVYATFIAGIGLQVTTGTALSLVVLDYLLGLIADQLIGRI
jgi:hypothetical protein